jgi:DNA polymerase III subunit gamma/tau
MSWYNKYRPSKFSEVIGQELVKSVLQNAVIKNKIKNGYLLSGSKGVGKTTIARIFASLINDYQNNSEAKIDVFELDAASNTGVHDIIDLIEEARTPPMVGKYKIYIIDEVHMLSKSAMSAMLKILEEPPDYLVFLLATTNPEKLLPTVLSRLTKLSLNNHTIADLFANLRRIADLEKLKIDDASLKLIASRASGSHRDAINLLETIASYELEEYSFKEVVGLLGLVSFEILTEVAEGILAGKKLEVVQKLSSLNVDGQTFLAQMLDFLVEKSLAGDEVFDELIIPVAEILSLKLSLDSSLTALALVQAKVGVAGKKKLVKNEVLDANRDLEQEVEPLVFNQETSTEAGKADRKLEEPEFDTKDKATQIKQFLINLAGQKNSPPILKMLISNTFCEIQNGLLVLATTNSVFRKQLESPNLFDFLQKEVKAKFAMDLKISGDLVDRKIFQKDVLEDVPNGTSNSIAQEIELQDDFEQKVAEQKESDLEAGDKKLNQKEVFYEIYQQYPENWNGVGVGLFKGSIALSNKKEEKATDLKNWEQKAEEFFDFE